MMCKVQEIQDYVYEVYSAKIAAVITVVNLGIFIRYLSKVGVILIRTENTFVDDISKILCVVIISRLTYRDHFSDVSLTVCLSIDLFLRLSVS